MFFDANPPVWGFLSKFCYYYYFFLKNIVTKQTYWTFIAFISLSSSSSLLLLLLPKSENKSHFKKERTNNIANYYLRYHSMTIEQCRQAETIRSFVIYFLTSYCRYNKQPNVSKIWFTSIWLRTCRTSLAVAGK